VYYQPVPTSQENLELMKFIDQQYLDRKEAASPEDLVESGQNPPSPEPTGTAGSDLNSAFLLSSS
jgi:hypothetical protein